MAIFHLIYACIAQGTNKTRYEPMLLEMYILVHWTAFKHGMEIISFVKKEDQLNKIPQLAIVSILMTCVH